MTPGVLELTDNSAWNTNQMFLLHISDENWDFCIIHNWNLQPLTQAKVTLENMGPVTLTAT